MKKKIPLFILLGIIGNIVALLSYLLLYFALAGCNEVYSYTLSQPNEQVIKIEICQFDYYSKTVTPIKTLNEQETAEILAEIPELVSYRHFGDSTTAIGKIIIYITYADNTAEVLGEANTGIVDADGNWKLCVDYFERSEFAKMLLRYVDEDLLPKEYLEWAAESLSN